MIGPAGLIHVRCATDDSLPAGQIGTYTFYTKMGNQIYVEYMFGVRGDHLTSPRTPHRLPRLALNSLCWVRGEIVCEGLCGVRGFSMWGT